MRAAEENTGCYGPIYWTSFRASYEQPWVSTAWTREVEEPWRRGRGVALRTGEKLRTVGLWFPGPAPVTIERPLEVDTKEVRGYKRLTMDPKKRRREMLKLILWPFTLAVSLWGIYQWVKKAPLNWGLPFEDTEAA